MRHTMVYIVGQTMALAVLLAFVQPVVAATSQAEPRGEIRVPDNLPEPVGEEMRVDPNDLDDVLADANVVLLDVREPWELEQLGTREGYINIPLGELESRLDELPKDKTILPA